MRRGRVAQCAAVAVGVALVPLPALLGYAGERASDVQRAVGPLAASVALTSLWPATSSVRWVNVVLGPATIAVVAMTAPHDAVAWAVTIAASVALTVTGLLAPETGRDIGGGWSALVTDRYQSSDTGS